MILLLAAFYHISLGLQVIIEDYIHSPSALVGPPPSWGWQAVDGLIAFMLGLLVLAQWPASALWSSHPADAFAELA